MKTVVLGPQPPEIVAFIARRHALDQDRLDEVWEGEYHVVPAPHPLHGAVANTLARLLGPYADDAGLVGTTEFNLGEPGDFRVPDGGYHRGVPSDVFLPTAAIVVEVLSSDDETWEKFDFFARHHVDEICVARPPDPPDPVVHPRRRQLRRDRVQRPPRPVGRRAHRPDRLAPLTVRRAGGARYALVP